MVSKYSNFLKEIGCRFINLKIDNKGTSIVNDIILFKNFYKAEFFNKINRNTILIFESNFITHIWIPIVISKFDSLQKLTKSSKSFCMQYRLHRGYD